MIGRYAGGRDCHRCEATVGIADFFCRWCGAPVRKESRTKWGVTD